MRRERRKFSHLSAHSASTMEYIGREVAKTFKNHGTFKGKVLDYDKQHGFHVEYEDGDSEDMKESDLLKILTKTMRLDGPACLSGMSRRSTPRTRASRIVP